MVCWSKVASSAVNPALMASAAALSLASMSSTSAKNGASASAAVPDAGPDAAVVLPGGSRPVDVSDEVAAEGAAADEEGVGGVDRVVDGADVLGELGVVGVRVAVPATGDPAHAASVASTTTVPIDRDQPKNRRPLRTIMIGHPPCQPRPTSMVPRRSGPGHRLSCPGRLR
jgi:hypothetical protein